MRVHIRWMIRRDLEQVLALESDIFQFPWQESHFINCLRERNCIGMVAEDGDAVVGYMIYTLEHRSIRLLNLGVERSYWRQGVGTAMLDKLKSKLTQQRRSRILLEVRETNLAAQQFFRSQGFKAVGILRDFYLDSDEDAYTFCFRHGAVDVPLGMNRIARICGGK